MKKPASKIYYHTPNASGYIANVPAGAPVRVVEQPQAYDEVTDATAAQLLKRGLLAEEEPKWESESSA